MERRAEPSTKDLLGMFVYTECYNDFVVDKEHGILQEKIRLLTLQVSERDEKINQMESELRGNIKMQTKVNKARTFVMEQLKSAFKRKKGNCKRGSS